MLAPAPNSTMLQVRNASTSNASQLLAKTELLSDSFG
jgi:hypothetical protein